MSKSSNNLKFKALFDWGISKGIFEKNITGIVKKKKKSEIKIKELEDE